MPDGSLPAWIYKRDGRLVPFESDKISQALFAATETLGQPNAFLARELTEGVLHFLAQEEAGTPTTALVRELVTKVVRELGQPAVARAFSGGAEAKASRVQADKAKVVFAFSATDSPDAVVAGCLREYSLHAVFARDLVAAQADGLLSVFGLEAPLQLAACVAGAEAHSALAGGTGTAPWFCFARDVTRDLAQVVCLDSPEYALATEPLRARELTAKNLARLMHTSGREIIINLGCSSGPAWASEGATGPLFADQQPAAANPEEVAALADSLIGNLVAQGHVPGCRVNWHLGEPDFIATAARGPRLVRLARLALEWPGLTFTFNRPRRPIVLGDGLDRAHPAVLLAVGLHLPRLFDLPGGASQPAAFLQKLATLGRLALSAAVQKRNYLRRQGKDLAEIAALARGFLLERARLLVVPIGLVEAVRRLTGHDLLESKPGLELARQMIEHLRGVLEEEGRRANLDGCIDGITALGKSGDDASDRDAALPRIAGLTAWTPGTPPRQQLRTASVLHAAAGSGTAALFLPEDLWQQPEAMADLLHYAWRQTDVVSLRLVPSRPRQPALLPS